MTWTREAGHRHRHRLQRGAIRARNRAKFVAIWRYFSAPPPWLLPTPEYHQEMTPEELWLFREIPHYAQWFRFFLFRTRGADGYLPLLCADKDWQGPAGTIGEGNEMMRAGLLEGLAEQVGDDPELLQKLTPDYPPGGKRPVVDDGSYVDALKRDNVQLQTIADRQGRARGRRHQRRRVACRRCHYLRHRFPGGSISNHHAGFRPRRRRAGQPLGW